MNTIQKIDTRSHINEFDTKILAQALMQASKNKETWTKVTRFYQESSSGYSTWSWESIGVKEGHGQVSCHGVTISSENGVLRVKIVGSPRLSGEEAGMAFATKLMQAGLGKEGGIEMINMTSSRIITELTTPLGRRKPVPSYRERISSVRVKVLNKISQPIRSKISWLQGA